MKTTGKWLALCLAILLLTGLCGAQAAEAPAREIRFDKTVLELPSAAVEKLSYRYIIAFEGAGDLSGLQLAVVETAEADAVTDEAFTACAAEDRVLTVEGVRDGQTVILRGLPEGCGYTVTEVKADAAADNPAQVYTCEADGELSLSVSGTVGAEDFTHHFVNRYKPIELDILTKTSVNAPGTYTFKDKVNTRDYLLREIWTSGGSPTYDTTRVVDADVSAPFTFRAAQEDWIFLTDPQGNVVQELTGTLTIGEGTADIVFNGKIWATREGTFELLVWEEDGGLPGVTYDLGLRIIRLETTNRGADYDLEWIDTRIQSEVMYQGEMEKRRDYEGAGFTNYGLGVLEIAKAVDSSRPADHETSYSFTVAFGVNMDASAKGIYHYTYGLSEGSFSFDPNTGIAEVTFSLKEGEKAVFTGLPSGAVWGISEADAPYMASAYTVDGVAASDLSEKADAYRIEAGAVRSVVYTNKRLTADLIIDKTLVSREPVDANERFVFTVTLSDGETPVTSAPGAAYVITDAAGETVETGDASAFPLTVKLRGGDSARISGLPAGFSYAVTEEADQRFGVVYVGDTGLLTPDDPAHAVFTNERRTGDLLVVKTVENPNAVTGQKRFRYALETVPALNGVYGGVTFTDGKAEFDLADGEEMAVTGLPVGTVWTLTETKADDSAPSDVYTARCEGAQVTENGDLRITGIITDETGEPERVEYINRYKPLNLSGEKTITGLKDGVYTFRYVLKPRLLEENNENLDSASKAIAVNVAAPYTDNYKLDSELASARAGIENTDTAWKNWFYLVRGGEITDEIYATVTFTVTGGQTLSRSFTFDGEIVVLKEGYFELTASEVADPETYPDIAFDGQVYVIRVGAKNRTEADDYDIAITDIWTLNEVDGESRRDPVGGVSFVNRRETTGLTVEKTVESPIEGDIESAFAFTLTLSEAPAEGKWRVISAEGVEGPEQAIEGAVVAFSLRGGEKAVFTGLPVGAVCRVEEENGGDFTTVTEGEPLVRLTNENALVRFINSRKLVSVSVRKVWDDNENAEGLRPESVSVRLTAAGETIRTVTLSEENGWTATVEDLPATSGGIDIAYAWAEDASGLPQGYVLSGTAAEGLLTTLTNSLQRGGLIISKTVLNPNLITGNKEFRFHIKVQPALNGAYGQVTLVSGEADFSLRHGQSVSITGLPVGTSYEITEIKAEDGAADDVFIAAVTGAESQVTAEGDLRASGRVGPDTGSAQVIRYINRYIKPELSIGKTVSGLRDGVYTFRFRVTAKTLEETANENLSSSDKPIAVNVGEPWDDNYKLDEELRSATAGIGNTAQADGSWLYLLRDGQVVNELTAEVTFRVTGGETQTRRVSVDGEIVILKEGYIELLLEEIDDSETYPEVTFDDSRYVVRIGAKNRTDEDSYDIGITDIWALVRKGEEYRRDPVGEAMFVNRRETASLLVTKEVVSPVEGDASRRFGFTLRLSEAAQEGAYTLRHADGTEEAPAAFTGTALSFSLASGESVFITGLPVGAVATVTEQDAPDFTVTVNGAEGNAAHESLTAGEAQTFSFVNTRKLASATVRKVWLDNGNASGQRPLSLSVRLLANNTDSGRVAVLNSANTWTVTFDDLPATRNGQEITYTWDEDLPAGYTLIQVRTQGTVTTLTNERYEYEYHDTEARVRKVWNDSDNRDGIRPASIVVTLLKDGQPLSVHVLNARNGWAASVTGLPTGHTYTWREDEVPEGYVLTTQTSGTLTTLTNTHTAGETERSIRKVWNDADNQDGLRPESVRVSLWQDGVRIGQYTLNAENAWAVTVSYLPVRVGGREVLYTWSEDEVPEGYVLTQTLNGAETLLTNTHAPAKTGASVRKVWNDGEDQDGLRPEHLTVTLTAGDGGVVVLNGEVVKVTLSADNHWTETVTGLDRYAGGQEILYSWTESEVPEGYTLTNVAHEGLLTTLTNTHVPALTEAEVQKNWDDRDNRDGKRPESITVTLLRDGEPMASYVLNASNSWHVKVTGLPVCEEGRTIVYSWQEDEGGLTAGYALTDTAVEGTLTILRNSRTSGALTVTKTVVSPVESDFLKQFAFTVTLDEKLSGVYGEMTFVDGLAVFSLQSGGRKTATGLPAGIGYTVTETDSAGLTLSYTGETGIIVSENEQVAAFVNTHELVDVPVRKEWVDGYNADGVRPESVTVRLCADGVELASAVLNEGNGWKHVFTGLEKYAADGHEIAYTVSEDEVKSYTTGVYENTRIENGVAAADGYLVRNIHEAQTVEISGQKTWVDDDNQDGLRPVAIVVHLLADGTTINTITVTEADGWKWRFTGLPEMAEGRPIVYTITEEPVVGYTTQVDGYNLINTHSKEKTNVVVAKAWNDSNNADGIRPSSVTVHLLANGIDTGLSLVLSSANNWSGSFTDLEAYADGVKIIYTVLEDGVTGYTTWYEGTADTVITVVNRHTPEYTTDRTTPPGPDVTPTVTPYVPRTGDDTPLGLYIGLAVAALAALGAVAFALMKNKKK